MKTRKLNVDFIKIDVEGFELDVLLGACETIARCRPRIVMEFSAFTLSANRDISPMALLRHVLKEYGSFVYLDGTEVVTAGDDRAARDFFYRNMVVRQCVDDISFGGS